jgi:hypothetical protein
MDLDEDSPPSSDASREAGVEKDSDQEHTTEH